MSFVAYARFVVVNAKNTYDCTLFVIVLLTYQ